MAISSDEIPISHLQRRKIEGRVLVPFIEEARKRFGDQATRELVVAVIRQLAVADGARWSEAYGRDFASLKKVAEEIWAGGGSLELEAVAANEDGLDFNVTRCRYAEFAMIDGFNPDLALTRTQTVMEGASHCDFRFSKKPEVGP